jgi:glycosyltransferase involved in cell wall biosynthesis
VTRCLLLIPSVAKTGIDASVEADDHPTMDYHALAARLRDCHGAEVTLLDYAAVDQSPQPLVRLLRRLCGRDVALAAMGLLRRRTVDAIFTNGENVSIPLSLLFRIVGASRRRPAHVTIGHRLSAGKKRLFFRFLHVDREMDVVFVYAAMQRDIAMQTLAIPDSKLRLIPFHADHRFFRPRKQSRETPGQVGAAGLEWRDYPTLLRAAGRMPDYTFRLAAASPWSRHTNETENRVLPENVTARRYGYSELRALYADSESVAVPLYDNDFQAGVTTLLEAMAMGKPVVVTRTQGQTDVIIDGENGLTTPPGDDAAWEATLRRLHEDAALRQRLGEAGRRWLEEHATLERWASTVADSILEYAGDRAAATVGAGRRSA